MTRQRGGAALAQPARALLGDGALYLRHAGGRRARPRRVRKDVQVGEAALVDEIERAGEPLFALGREAGDKVSAERHVGPQAPHLFAEGDSVGAAVAALHALENEIVAGL